MRNPLLRILPSKPGIQGNQGIQGIQGIQGEDGPAGVSAYLYVGYASNNTGTADFKLTPDATSSYVALKSSSTVIASPVYTDFTGLWVKAKGDIGNTGATGAGSALRTFSWVIDTPIAGTILGPRLPETYTLTRIDAKTADATNVVFHVKEETNALHADLTATTSGVSLTTGFYDTTLNSGNFLKLTIVSVSGTPLQLVVTVTATI